MRILALESSARAASVALCDGETLVAQYFQNSGLTHSRTLLKMAEDMLSCAGWSLSSLDYVAVASGPGSFTGIRIGVSAAVGLAWGADLPVCGVSTLEAMAHQVEDASAVVCPVMDARREQVYTATFECGDGCVRRLSPDRAVSIDALADEARRSTRPYMLIGDGAIKCAEAFSSACVRFRLAPRLLLMQTAWGVARASMFAPKLKPHELRPNYLRPSQAERERLERAGKAAAVAESSP